MSFTFAYDVTAPFYGTVPKGFQLCGYDTGSGIAWTPEMWAAHPGAVHIDQAPDTAVLANFLELPGNPVSTSFTSDVLDVETGAVPVGSPLIAAWVKAAAASYAAARRPGQRMPLLYCSESNKTANVNALVKGGVTSGVGLWVADWALSYSQAIAVLTAASGPFPVLGVQFNDDGDYDSDVFSAAWLETVSQGAWAFGPVRSAVIWPGVTTFGVSFYSPSPPAPAAVADYEIAVSAGHTLGTQVRGYPVYVPKAATSGQGYQGHGLAEDTVYTVGIRAVAENGSHAGPWVTAVITTGVS
jgi:hypothetical protein